MEVAALGLRVESREPEKAADALDRLTKSAQGAEKSSDRFGKSATDAGRKAKTANESASRSADRMAASYSKVSDSLATAAKRMMGFAAATVGIAAMSRTLTSFEQSMASVSAITRATTEELADMRDMAKQLGATTEFAASQAADGLKFLGMAGFSASQSLAAIPAVLDLATGAAMDLSEAADIATNIMSGFSIQAQDAAQVADVLAAAASRSNTSVQQLGGAMSTVAPIASALSISLADTAAAIGVMSDAGIQGERAGTALRGVLASLAGPTTAAQKALAGIGLTIEDVNPATTELSVIFGRLKDAGLSTADAMTVFGREAASGALVLVESAEYVKEFGETLDGAAGEAKRMADIMRDNLAGDFKSVASALEGFVIALGEAGLISALRGASQLITSAIRSVTSFVGVIGTLTNAIGTALSPALNVVGSALIAVAQNADIALVALSALYAPAIISGIALLTRSLSVGLVNSIQSVTVALMRNPFGLIAVAIAAGITALIKFDAKAMLSAQSLDAIGAAWDVMTGAISSGVETIMGWYDKLNEWTHQFFDLFKSKPKEAADQMESSFSSAFMAVLGFLDDVYAGFMGNAAAIGALFEALGHNIREAFVFAFAKAREAASDMLLSLSAVLAQIGIKLDVTPYVGPAKADFVSLGEAASAAFNESSRTLGALDAFKSSMSDRKIEREIKNLESWYEELGVSSGGAAASISKLTPEVTSNTKATSAAAKAAEAFAKARQDSFRNHRNEISSIHQQAQALEDQVKVFGQGKHALDKLAIARMEEQAAMLRGFEGSEEAVRLLELEIEAMNRRMNAGMSLDKLEEQKAAHDEMLANWKQTVDEYDRVFRDGFAGMLNNGKSGWKSFTKSLVTTFKTSVADQIYKMFAQPFVVNLVANMMGMTGMTGQQGGIGGALQQGGGGAPGLNTMMGGGVGGYLNSFGKTIGSSMVADFGAGMTAGASGSSFIPGLGVSSTGGGLGAGAGTSAGQAGQFAGANLPSILGYATALYDLSQGNYGSAVGTAIGTAILPGVGTVVGNFLGSMVDGIFGHEPRTRHGKSTVYELTDGNGIYRKHDEMRHEDEYYRSMEQMTQAAIDGITNTFDLLGVDATLGNFWSRTDISTNPNSNEGDGVSSGGAVMVGGKWIDIGIPHSSDDTKFGVGGWSDEPVLPRLAMDLQLTMLEAFQAASEELPTILAGMLEGVDIRGMGVENAQALAAAFDAVIQQVGMLQTAVETLPFESLRDLSFDAAANLIKFAGGLENLDAGMTAYFQNFYTESEQLEWQAKQLGGAFESLGLTMPDVTTSADEAKAAYREIVEALDVNTESGAQAYATLMTLSGGFAELATGMENLNSVVTQTTDHIAAAFGHVQSLASQLSRSLQTMNAGGALADRIGGMLGLDPVFAARREQALWDTIGSASYEQQIQMSGELTDIVLGRISKEQEAAQAQIAAINSQITSLSRMRDLASSLQGYLNSLESSDLAPYSLQEKVGIAESELASLVSAARGGDETAMRQVQGSLQNALKLWRDYGASGEEYQDAYKRLTGMAGNLASAALSDADRQIKQLESQAASLASIDGYTEEQLAQLQMLYDITTAATEAASKQHDALMGETHTELAQLERMGLDTARLHDIANLLQGLPAQIGAQLAGGMSAGSQYLMNNPDVNDAFGRYGQGQSVEDFALDHYEQYGHGEGRQGTRGQDYLVRNPDVLAAYLSDVGAQEMGVDAYAKFHWDKYGQYEKSGRASYDVGTSFVPRDMTADIHRGEIIIDPRSSDILRRYGIGVQGGGGNNEVASELRMLRQEVAQLRQQNEALGRAQVTAVVESSRENAKQITSGVSGSIERRNNRDFNDQNSKRRGVLV